MDGSHVFLSWWIVLVLGIVWLPHDMCVHVYGVCVCVCVLLISTIAWMYSTLPLNALIMGIGTRGQGGGAVLPPPPKFRPNDITNQPDLSLS